MRTHRQSLLSQRALMEQKVQKWARLRSDAVPRSGWIKAIRGALGMNTRQLAERVGVAQSNITRLEEREPTGKVTLDRLARVAQAMRCKVIYAVVPEGDFADLDAIIESQARRVAEDLVRRTEHSMRLEKQGTDNRNLTTRQVQTLVNELKSKLDPRIWSTDMERKPSKAAGR